MIYDDQPQMVQAAAQCEAIMAHSPTKRASGGLETAFAAIDREALIEKVARASHARCVEPGEGPTWEHFVPGAEMTLVAAGILPERAP